MYKLFSTDLQQRGEDNEGIEGFLLKDIRKILKNTNNIKCCYCGLPNATARCQYNRCQKIFHFFCGMHKNALSQFCGAFTSFCDKHNLNRSKNIRRYLAISTYSTNCIYCQEIITPDSDYFVTECCRSCVMHKTCLKVLNLQSCSSCCCSFQHCVNGNSFFRDTLWHTAILLDALIATVRADLCVQFSAMAFMYPTQTTCGTMTTK